MVHLPRVVESEVARLLAGLPAVSIEGAKAVGKTYVAERLAATTRRLDDDAARQVFEADPRLMVAGVTPVLIDEWQRMPASWDLVRRAVDDDPSPGRFLLTGSATPRGPTHSGAGRIVRMRMRPLSLPERKPEASTAASLAEMLAAARPTVSGTTDVALTEYVDEIVGSGFPGLRQRSPTERSALLDGYIDQIVEREFAEVGHTVRRPAALRRWLRALAAGVATTASYEKLRDASTPGHDDKPAKTTVLAYNDVLERLWIYEPLEAWLPVSNELKRLAQAPKHHLVDPALAARLMRRTPQRLLADGQLLGRLFESLVTLSVRVCAQAAGANVFHLREAGGREGGKREVDLIVEARDGGVVAMEVKLSATIDDGDVKQLRWLRDRLGDELVDAAVINTGPHAYRRRDGIAVIPLAMLGP